MVAIPLSLIGIILGHWMLDAFFTATSFIGMIALAGIMVRNSVLLIDFVNLRVAEGFPLKSAVIYSIGPSTTSTYIYAFTLSPDGECNWPRVHSEWKILATMTVPCFARRRSKRLSASGTSSSEARHCHRGQNFLCMSGIEDSRTSASSVNISSCRKSFGLFAKIEKE